jgi:hypothetical protein
METPSQVFEGKLKLLGGCVLAFHEDLRKQIGNDELWFCQFLQTVMPGSSEIILMCSLVYKTTHDRWISMYMEWITKGNHYAKAYLAMYDITSGPCVEALECLNKRLSENFPDQDIKRNNG